MDTRPYLAILASGAFAIGVAGCDAGDPGDPGTPEPESSAMYDAEETEDATESMADRQEQAEDRLQQSTREAQQEVQEQQDRYATTQDTPLESLDTLGTDEIIGKTVVSQQGEDIGEIEEVVMDTNSQQHLAVIDVGGFLGIGEKSVAVAFDQLQLADDGRVRSDLTKETLQAQPEYDPAQYGEAEEDPME